MARTKLTLRIKEVERAMVTDMRMRLNAVGTLLVQHARKKMNDAYLVEYKNKKTGEDVVEVSKSSGFDWPKKRSGDLRKDVDYFLYSSRLGGRWGTNLDYGRWLELGTIYMAPRPWMSLTESEKRKEVKRWLTGRLK